MGWSLKRMLRNPVSLLSPVAGGYSQFDPGPNGADQPAPGYERRGADQVQWDPITGMPIGTAGPPAHEVALQYQYRSQELIRKRQQALWGDAQNVLGQGANLLSSYRPGGSAALASGIFGARSNAYQNQAANLEEPDLMSAYREDKEILAAREAKRARNLQIGLGLVQAAATIATGGIGGVAAGIAAAGAQGLGQGLGQGLAGANGNSEYGPYQSGYQAPDGTGYGAPAPGPWAPPGEQPAAPVYGPTPPPGFAPGVTNQAPYPSSGQGGYGPPTANATMPGGPGGSGALPGGGGGSGGAPGGGKGGPGAERSGFSQSGAGGSGYGGGMAMLGGGYGQDGMFNSAAAGRAAMMGGPEFGAIVLEDIRDDPLYKQSTSLRVTAARKRLLEALA